MLRIRLQRTGNKNNPTFRLVVTEKSNAAKGKSLEFLGHYLPTRDPSVFEFDQKRVEHWIANGASPTDTVARLLSRKDVKGMEKYMEQYSKKKKKKEVEEKPEPVASPPPPPSPATEEAPKEEPAAAPEAPVEEAKEEEKPAEEVKEEGKPEELTEEKEDDKKEGDS